MQVDRCGTDSTALRCFESQPPAPRKFNQAKQHFCPVVPAKKRTAVHGWPTAARPGWLASQPFPDVGLASHQLQTRMKSRYRASELHAATLTESDEFLSNI